MPAPICVIIPTLNAGQSLPRLLASLSEANAAGLIREVVVSDGGSADDTVDVAEEAGCRIVFGEACRGAQLARGADAVRGPWMLFLHADTALASGWAEPAIALIERGDTAGVFRHGFRGKGLRRALVSFGANARTWIAGLPYGDQGLLISKDHYARVGGYEPVPLFEDVAIARRIVAEGGRRALRVMAAQASTSSERYDRDGYATRVWRNQRLVFDYFRGVPHASLAERYR